MRVKINDNEAANNIVQTIGNTVTLDVKTPAIGTHPLLVDATSSPATITLSSTDDSALKMNINLTNTFPAILSTAYSSSAALPLLTDPDTVYVEFQDAWGNTTPVYSAATPETPTSVMIQDTSNMLVTPHEYRLFTAWKLADPATPVFAHYNVYRSDSSNGTYAKIGISDTRAANYYGDSTAQSNQHYYYKAALQDADGNISYYSSIVDGMADGVQDYGEGGGGTLPPAPPPVISNVQIANVTSSAATVTWTTDVLANSTVGYSTAAGNFGTEIGNPSYVTTGHSVTLFGLTQGTTYYLQAKSLNASNIIGTDANGVNGYTFTTQSVDTTPPVISNVSSGNPGYSSANITWTTDENATSFLEYSTSNGFTQGTFVGNFNLNTAHSVIINSLSANTTYYYKVHSSDTYGNERITSQSSFTTASDPHDYTPPIISNVSSGTPSYNSATLTWNTDENADSFVEYGTTISYGRITGFEDSVMGHSITLPTSLLPATTYHFRIRSRDASGNEAVSGDYTFATAADPHDYNAPIITNVTVTSTSRTGATITWTTDEASDSYIGYSTNTSYAQEQGAPAAVTSHSVTLAGLTPGILYNFQVKSRDGSGNLATDNNSGNYNFATDPGPVGPVISNVSSGGASQDSVTVTWTTDLNSNSFVEYGLDTSYGLSAGKYDSTKNHSVVISGLQSSVTYHFRVRSIAETEGVSGDYTFTTAPHGDTTPPGITNISSGTPGYNTTTLTWTTDEVSTSYVEYGATTAYGKIFGKDDSVLSHSVALPADLTAGTTYHFRVRSKDSSGNEGFSGDYTFMTAADPHDTTPPAISSVLVASINPNSATIVWTTNENSDSYVGYSLDTSYDVERGTSAMNTAHTVTVSGLTQGTLYHFRVKSRDAAGNLATDDSGGASYTFTTQSVDITPPVISDIASGTPSYNSANLSWTTDESATSFVEYSTSDNFSQGVFVGNYTLATSHSVVLYSLSANTVYYYKVHSADASGNDRISSQNSFTTSADPHDYTPPVITNVSSGTPLYDTATITWTTDENSDSFVEYGLTTSYGRMTGLEDSMKSHSVTLPTNLTPATTYHIRVHSRDASGNEAVSEDYTFDTGADPHDTYSPVITNVSVVSVSRTSATISWLTDENSDSYVGFSQNQSFTAEQGSPAPTTVHSITLVGLTPGTGYHFQVKSTDGSGNTKTDSNSGNYNFSTDAGPATPAISAVTVTGTTYSSAGISWTTDIFANSFVEYGLDTSYGLSAGKYDSTKNHSITLTGLQSSATYHFRVRSTAETEGVSADYIFTTPAHTDDVPPIISAISVTSVTSSGATVSWSTNESADSIVNYGTTNNYSQRGGNESVSGMIHSINLNNLRPGTTYHYRIDAKDASGNPAISSDGTFTTGLNTTAPVLSNVSAQVVGPDQVIITWDTDIFSSSEIDYGKTHSLDNSSAMSTPDMKHHYILLAGLDPDTKYYFKANSTDVYSNQGESGEDSFTTQKDPTYQHDPLMAITNVSNPPSVVTDTKAVITWDTDQPANSVVEFGTISNTYNELPITNNNLDTHHSVTLASLLPQTTYYFKISSEDNLNNAISSKEYSFATLPKQINENPVGGGSAADTTPPSISNKKTSSATANSIIISWNTDEDSDGKVRYGLDNNYGQAAAEDITVSDTTKFTTKHEVVINGLLSNTAYHFMIASTDLAGNIGQSSDDSFRTSAIAALSGVSITNITLSSAVVTWETASPTTSVVEYGSTTSYGKNTSDKTNANTHKIELTSLSAGQTYHLRVNGLDKNSNSVASDDYIFATYATPKLETYNVDEVTDSLAKLTWKTNVPTDSMVEYLNKASGESSTQGMPDTTADHRVSVTNLEAGTEYEVKIKGTDVNKNSFTSNPFTLTTAADTQSPDISQVKTESSLISGKEEKVQSIIFWKTNESSTSQVRFEEGVTISDTFSQESREDDNLTTNHIIVLTNLKPGTVYHFKVVSKDQSGNESISENFTLLAPQKSQSIIQLIVSNFEQTFGWLRKIKG